MPQYMQDLYLHDSISLVLQSIDNIMLCWFHGNGGLVLPWNDQKKTSTPTHNRHICPDQAYISPRITSNDCMSRCNKGRASMGRSGKCYRNKRESIWHSIIQHGILPTSPFRPGQQNVLSLNTHIHDMSKEQCSLPVVSFSANRLGSIPFASPRSGGFQPCGNLVCTEKWYWTNDLGPQEVLNQSKLDSWILGRSTFKSVRACPNAFPRIWWSTSCDVRSHRSFGGSRVVAHANCYRNGILIRSAG